MSTKRAKNEYKESEPIKYDKGTPGISLHWDSASDKNVYISHITYGSEYGTHFCITDFNYFPKLILADVSCNYHVPAEFSPN